jgi:hypothetical protein
MRPNLLQQLSLILRRPPAFGQASKDGRTIVVATTVVPFGRTRLKCWTRPLRKAACGFAAAALLSLPPGIAGAETARTARPAAGVLIAAAKATPLAKFAAQDAIKAFKIEAWLKERVGRKGQIAWRSTSCRAKVEDRDIYNSPLCVEAVIRYRNGISITVGVGFDEKAPRAAPVANAMWGSIAVKGRGCEFLRHPDYIDAALLNVDPMIKSGRCE